MAQHEVSEVQAVVHERLHAKDSTSTKHYAGAGCCCYTLDQVVWETLALLGEWEIVEMLVPPETMRAIDE